MCAAVAACRAFLMRAYLVRFAWGLRSSTASAAAVLLAEVHHKYTMVLIGRSAAAAGMNTAMRYSEDLQKLMGTNMYSGAAAHKAMSMYSEALPPVTTIVNMGSLAAAAGTAAARSRSAEAQCLRLVEAHRHSSGWK